MNKEHDLKVQFFTDGNIQATCRRCEKFAFGKFGQKNPDHNKGAEILKNELNHYECKQPEDVR